MNTYELSRLSELAVDSEEFANVLGDMGCSQKQKFFKNIESELENLPDAAWAALKIKVSPYLKSAIKRGWQQLYDHLNEAKGYNHLVDLGCEDVQFIPEGNGKAPDLKGTLGKTTVLLEVKTINASDEEATARAALKSGGHRLVDPPLPCLEGAFLFGKFTLTLENAKTQMDSYMPNCSSSNAVCRIIFVILNYDDILGEYDKKYKKQLQDFVQEHNPAQGCEIMLFSDSAF